MRIIWTGQDKSIGALVLRVDAEVLVAPGLKMLRMHLSADGELHTLCLVDFDAGGRWEPVLDYLNREHPLVPVGLVSRSEDRAAAFVLLRARRVDRVIPQGDLDDGLDAHIEALAAHGRCLAQLRAVLHTFEGVTFLVTGATGFLGGHFVRYLLRCSGARVVALTRATPLEAHDQRLAHLERLHPGRIQYVEGDVRTPGLGIDAAQRAWMSREVDAIWHFAADTRFEAILRDELFRANVDGTRNVVQFAQSLQRLRHFHHVSTAYVAGDGRGGHMVPEMALDRPSAFKNPYEASKFAAERIVADSGLPATIYRPSIILGERVSGLCDGQTVYKVAQLLRLALLSAQRSRTAAARTFRVVVDPETTKNLIPADDVVCPMLMLAARETGPGRYHHLTHPEPTLMADLISVMAGVLDIPEYEAVSTLEGAILSPAEAVLQRISGVFKPYMLNSDPAFARCGAGGVAPVKQADLRFLLQSFFEQHYGWEFQPLAVGV